MNFCSEIKIYNYTTGMPDVALHGCIRKLNDMGFEALVAVSITVMFVGNAVYTCNSIPDSPLHPSVMYRYHILPFC